MHNKIPKIKNLKPQRRIFRRKTNSFCGQKEPVYGETGAVIIEIFNFSHTDKFFNDLTEAVVL